MSKGDGRIFKNEGTKRNRERSSKKNRKAFSRLNDEKTFFIFANFAKKQVVKPVYTKSMEFRVVWVEKNHEHHRFFDEKSQAEIFAGTLRLNRTHCKVIEAIKEKRGNRLRTN